ncbi:MAG: hypothetical protein Kow0069_02020 [Promethearchaeota archaeon]
MSGILEKALLVALGAIVFTSTLVFLFPVLSTVKDLDNGPEEEPWLFTEVVKAVGFVSRFPDQVYHKNVTLDPDLQFEVVDGTILRCRVGEWPDAKLFQRDLQVPVQLHVSSTTQRCELYVFREDQVVQVYFV